MSRVSILGISGFPTCESQTKWHLDVAPMANNKEYYMVSGGCGESCEFVYARGSFVY
jgi:hypothetical protein